jgi:actin-like ATPase involved in cell morphogenesis
MASTTADGSTDKLRILALDLGTTMTRFCDVGVGQVVSHPTLLLRDRRGRPVAAGWNAWHLALHRPAHLRHPVRRGVVVNAHDCANMLRLLLAEEGLSPLDGVALSLPAVATRVDTKILAAAVRAATGAPIVSMRPAVASAAAHGSNEGDLPTRLICDVGASVIEVGAFHRQRLRVQMGTHVDVHAYVDEPAAAVGELLRLVHNVLGRLRKTVADELIAAPVMLIGGAHQSRPLRELLDTSLHLNLELAEAPETAAVSGLARHVSGTLHRAQ